jgi:hypothetical protein
MKEISFDFLDGLEVQSVEASSSKLGIIDKQPTGSRIRLFNDGKVFPSPEIVESFKLQYMAKGNPDQGYGFDVFSTLDWGQWPDGAPQNLVLIAPVPKTLAKVDLFASTKFDEEGQPRADVNSQGTSTFGKSLIKTLTKTYGNGLFKTDGGERIYLDLEIRQDHPLKPVNNGIYTVPKWITKGKFANTMGYERRENIPLYPLVPVLGETDTPVKEEPVAVEKTEAPAVNGTPVADVTGGNVTPPKEVKVTLPSDRAEAEESSAANAVFGN